MQRLLCSTLQPVEATYGSTHTIFIGNVSNWTYVVRGYTFYQQQNSKVAVVATTLDDGKQQLCTATATCPECKTYFVEIGKFALLPFVVIVSVRIFQSTSDNVEVRSRYFALSPQNKFCRFLLQIIIKILLKPTTNQNISNILLTKKS